MQLINGQLNLYNGLDTSGSSVFTGSVNISGPLNSELVPSLVSSNWTSTNFTVSSGSISHTIGTIGTTSPTTPLSITVGKVYKITYTLSGSVNSYTGIQLGGNAAQLQIGTNTLFFLAQTTANLSILNSTVGDPTFTISSLSIKQLTDNTGTLTVDGAVQFNSTLAINNLGIGTTSVPTAPLQIVDNNGNGIRVTRNTNVNQYIAIHEGGGACHTIEAFGDKPLRINNQTSTNFGIEFYTQNVYRGQFSTNGNLLLNTSTESGNNEKIQVNGSVKVTNDIILGNSKITNSTTSPTSGIQTISTQVTSSNGTIYNSAFYNYSITSGSNARAGQIISIWNGSQIQYTDVSTLDIGDTTSVAFTSSLSGPNIVLNTVLPSNGWTIKVTSNLL
jgi:hypothetical protein